VEQNPSASLALLNADMIYVLNVLFTLKVNFEKNSLVSIKMSKYSYNTLLSTLFYALVSVKWSLTGG